MNLLDGSVSQLLPQGGRSCRSNDNSNSNNDGDTNDDNIIVITVGVIHPVNLYGHHKVMNDDGGDDDEDDDADDVARHQLQDQTHAFPGHVHIFVCM